MEFLPYLLHLTELRDSYITGLIAASTVRCIIWGVSHTVQFNLLSVIDAVSIV